MALDISSYHSAKLLPEKVQGLINNCFNDLNWLRAFEEFSGIAMEPCHYLMTSNGIPIGFLPGFIQHDSLCGTLGERLFGRFFKLPFLHGLGTTKAFVCASPWGYYSGIECDSNFAPEITAAFIAHIDRIVKDRNLMLSGFTYVPEFSYSLRSQLEANGYRAFPNLPTSFIELQWTSFDEYVSQVPRKQMHRNIRTERKRATELTYEWFEGDSLDTQFSGQPLHEILLELHNQNWLKHNDRQTPLKKSFLAELWKMDKPNLRLCLTSLEKRIVAFCLLRVLGDTAHALMMGQDYDCAKNIPVYFNAVYYEPIIRGISEGWKRIFFRPGVYEAKLRRGIKLGNLYLYVKGHSKMTRKLLDIYIAMAWKHFHDKWVPPKLFNY